MLRLQGSRDVAQITALVTPGGKDERFARTLDVAQPDAERQSLHLAADIVHVILALHVESDGIEQVCEHRPVGGVAPMADVQGPGGIGRHELHLDSESAALPRASVRPARGGDLRHHALQGCVGEMEVDKAGTRDFDLANLFRFRQARHEPLCYVAWCPPKQGREAQRHRGREVTVAGVACPLHHDLRQGGEGELSVVAHRAERALDELVQMVLQSAEATVAGQRIVESSVLLSGCRRQYFGQPASEAAPRTDEACSKSPHFSRTAGATYRQQPRTFRPRNRFGNLAQL